MRRPKLADFDGVTGSAVASGFGCDAAAPSAGVAGLVAARAEAVAEAVRAEVVPIQAK